MSYKPDHIVLSGRFGTVLKNQAMLGETNEFSRIHRTEQFTNQILEWYSKESFIKSKVIQI